MAKDDKKPKVVKYKATKSFKNIVSNKGSMSESQYKSLLKGDSVEMKDVTHKQMNYLIANNLIEKLGV